MPSSIEIAFHLGAPFTDNDQLTWSLRKDSDLLSENGIMIRRPKEYRRILSDRISDLQGRKAPIESQEKLLASIIRRGNVKRLILSNGRFLGATSWMLSGRKFYQNAGNNTAALRGLFSENPCHFYLAIRNPAPFISSAYSAQNSRSYEEFKNSIRFEDIRWSDVIADIQLANPECPITVWCHEDSPVIWPTVLQKITTLEHVENFAGALDILKNIISFEGAARIEKYLEIHPKLSKWQREQVHTIFLEKFAMEEANEEEIDLPGWTHDLVDTITHIYEDDIQQVEEMTGVDFISPSPTQLDETQGANKLSH